MLRAAVILCAVSFVAGCLPPFGPDIQIKQDNPTTGCTARTVRDLSPGEMVGGSDPIMLLARYQGTWSGTIEWTVGGHAGLTLTIPPPHHLYCEEDCSVVYELFGDTTARVHSDDGILEIAPSATLARGWEDDDPESDLEPPSISPVSPNEFVLNRSPVNLSKYRDPALHTSISWETATPRPLSGSLSIRARLARMTTDDEWVIATLSFNEGVRP